MNLFRETRRNRRIVSGVMAVVAIADAGVASGVLLTHRSAAVAGGGMLVGAIILAASSIVLWSTAGRLPD